MGKELSDRKRIYFFYFDEDMNDLFKNIKTLKDSGVLIDGVTETVKHKIKEQEDGFLRALLALLVASLAQTLISSSVEGIRGRGVRRSG